MIAPSPHPYAAIYARVSTEDQGKGFSIPTQIEACQKLAEREGFTVPESHLLVDEGISGTTMDRPGLRKLRELVNAKAIGAVIVIDPDRLSRNLGHQLLLAEGFEQAGVKLLIVSHPMEQGPEGWLFFQMRGALAEYERAKILERMQRGRVGRVKAGHPGGGQVPLGYRAIREPHRGTWEIDPEEAALVCRIYAMCLSGMATRAIARELTEDRIPTRHDRTPHGGGYKTLPSGSWSGASVYKILTYEGYIGRARWGKWQNISRTRRQRQPIDSSHEFSIPPILDETTFEAAQHQLQRNRALAKRNRKYEYLLIGGRFRCGRCGRGMVGTPIKGVRYYRCNTINRVIEPSLRCRGSIRAEEAERRVWGAVERVLLDPQLVAAEVARQQEHTDERRAAVVQDLGLVEVALTKCDREEKRWSEAYAAEVINIRELKGYRAEIGTRRQRLQAQQVDLQATLDAIGQTVAHVEMLTSYCQRIGQRLKTFDVGEKRIALEALDIRVHWSPGEPLAIDGTIPLREGCIASTAIRHRR